MKYNYELNLGKMLSKIVYQTSLVKLSLASFSWIILFIVVYLNPFDLISLTI